MAHPLEGSWGRVEAYKKKFVAKDERRLLSQIEQSLVVEMEDRNAERDTEHLHPSAMAKTDWCPRESFYSLTNAPVSNPESFSLRRMNIFAEGHEIHDKWQRWMWKAGGLSGVFKCLSCRHGWYDVSPSACPLCGSDLLRYREVPIRNDAHRVIGHADGMWEDSQGRAVVEIKSVGLGTIRWDAPALYQAYDDGEIGLDELWKRIKRPLQPHRRQVSLYMYFLGVTEAIVIYEWKPTQEIKEFHLSLDMDLVQPLLDKGQEVWAAVESGDPPPRPENARKSGMCKYCAFKTMCWDG